MRIVKKRNRLRRIMQSLINSFLYYSWLLTTSSEIVDDNITLDIDAYDDADESDSIESDNTEEICIVGNRFYLYANHV